MRRILEWMESRTGIPGRVQLFLAKPCPPNIGWAHTLGSLLIVYLLLQGVTGVLLALYYSPSAEHAYESLAYVQEELFLGRFVLNLHIQGAGFVLLTAVLHLLRVLLTASYKKPREILWVSGICMLLLLTFFAFTGKLLPYDQRGYWATVVGLNLLEETPLLGPLLRDLLTGGTGALGSVTLARFYVLHVCVLPILLLALAGFHLRTLQVTGSAGPSTGAAGPPRPFFPWQVFRDVVVSTLGCLVLFLVAWTLPVPESEPASSSLGSYVPFPEWYFVPHYQLLRMLPPDWQFLGTTVLPGVLLAGLVVLPFVDRSPERRFRRRLPLNLVVLGGLLATVGLGIVGTVSHARRDDEGQGSVPAETAVLDPVQRGAELFIEHACDTCHTVGGQGNAFGPDLTLLASRMREDAMGPILRNPGDYFPEATMPPFEGADADLRCLVAYLRSLK